MQKRLPPSVVTDALNITEVGSPRTVEKDRFFVHVSDLVESDGPRAFCPRYFVMAYYTGRVRTGGKITPARKLLFATGHFMHDFYVKNFIKASPYGGATYANWSCRAWKPYINDADHTQWEGILDNVSGHKCKCGRALTEYNEVDLFLPKLRLTGHPDLLLLPEDTFYIHEGKTMERKDVSFDELAIPLSSHRLQVSFYYKMLTVKAKPLGYKVSRSLRVDYIDRSNSKLFGGKPFKTLETTPEPDENLAPFRNKLQHTVNGIASKRLPPRICPSVTCTRAKNCDLAVLCFELRRGTVGSGI